VAEGVAEGAASADGVAHADRTAQTDGPRRPL
jgi:hypothetical protein